MTEYYGEYNEPEIGMTLDEYQSLALESAVYADEDAVVYTALKLAGEAGEVAEKVGKRIRDAEGDFTDPDFLQAAKKEVGDVLWYVAAFADALGFTLEEVADTNLSKLASRMARGTIQGSGDDR